MSVQEKMGYQEIVRLVTEDKAIIVGLDGNEFEATITIETTDIHKHRFYCHVKGAQLLRCRQLTKEKSAAGNIVRQLDNEREDERLRRSLEHREQFGFEKDVTKGKCNVCKIVWYWKTGTRKLKDTRCPLCHYWLYATTKYMRRYDWRPYPERDS